MIDFSYPLKRNNQYEKGLALRRRKGTRLVVDVIEGIWKIDPEAYKNDV